MLMAAAAARRRAAAAADSRLVPRRVSGGFTCQQTRQLATAKGDAAPDATRGYDVAEYAGVWNQLARGQPWPQSHTISVVGPANEEFAAAAEACVRDELGGDAVSVSRNERKRWQAVRLDVLCGSPDDFCAVHARLRRLEGVKMVV